MNSDNPLHRCDYNQPCLWGLAVATVALFVFTPQHAQGDTITFDSLPTGAILADQFATSHGVRFSAVNNVSSHPDKLVVFDTDNYTGGDVDLAYPWTGGNLTGQRLSKIFVIAEDVFDGDNDGLVDDPDDEGRGGTVTIKFDSLLEAFRFDQVDRDDANGEQVQIYKQGSLLDTITYVQMETADPTIDFGNRKANRLPWITSATVGDVFDEVRIQVSGSHGFDNITYSPVPEPATMILLAIGAVPVVMNRRRAK